ncbi:MAG: hypothetical protein ACRDNK_05870 [Solirubrobacteraceae bacterium]
MAPSEIRQFLLIMDIREGRTEVRDFGTRYAAAVAAYQAAEAEHRGDSNYDIVLVGSDSLETVKLTHGRYFASSEDDLREAVQREIAALGAA